MTKLEQIAKEMEAAHKASTSYLDLARVVVETQREPTGGMWRVMAYEHANEVWTDMLDEILSEKPE